MKKLFNRTLQSLNEIFQFIDEYQNRYKLGSTTSVELQLIAEEMFTNMVKYNIHSKKAISLELTKKGNDLLITFTDSNGLPFRLESTDPYDTTLPLEERPIGKLGLLLVKKYVDDIQYNYTEGQSIITFIKKLKEKHV